ncbi:hypothetical protein Lser_V15G33959 [Lactuca serriola]
MKSEQQQVVVAGDPSTHREGKKMVWGGGAGGAPSLRHFPARPSRWIHSSSKVLGETRRLTKISQRCHRQFFAAIKPLVLMLRSPSLEANKAALLALLNLVVIYETIETAAENREQQQQGYFWNPASIPAMEIEKSMQLERQKSMSSPYSLWFGPPKSNILQDPSVLPQNPPNPELMSVLQGLSRRSNSAANSGLSYRNKNKTWRNLWFSMIKAVEKLDVVDGREMMVQFAKYGPNVEKIHKGRILVPVENLKGGSRS